MAIFGIESGAAAGCRAALDAARRISERLAELNASLRGEIDRPLRIGIGIHCGPTIIGEMEHGSADAITLIGNAVSTGSRLEELTKQYGCELVVSEEAVRRAELDLGAFPHEIQIRGRRETLGVRIVASASAGSLPAGIPSPFEPARA